MKNRKAFIVGIKSTNLNKNEIYFLKKNKPWGVIIFSRNIRNLKQTKKLISEIKSAEAEKLLYDGTITEGMIPKMRTCIDAIENGVRGVVIIDGRKSTQFFSNYFQTKVLEPL